MPTAQIDLDARKWIATRLLFLVEETKRAGALPDENTGVGGISIPSMYEHIQAGNQREGEIGLEILNGHSSTTPETLVSFLERVNLRPEPPADTEEFTTGLVRERRDFDCNECGPVEGACCGNKSLDQAYFTSPDDGLCLRFLKGMLELFAHEAERIYFKTLSSCTSVIPERMSLETHRKSRSARSTLPIDGEFVPFGKDGNPIVKVFWPIPELPAEANELDRAILTLPYLVFHEVFVHGAQGGGLNETRFKVEEDCAFTEGAVDAVACDLLVNDILYRDDTLPKIVRDLSRKFINHARSYHEERFIDDTFRDNLQEDGAGVRMARTYGRQHIYDTLLRIGKNYRASDTAWAQRIILLLNLLLSEEARWHFYYKVMKRLTNRTELWRDAVDDFDRFVEIRDPRWLFERLEKRLKSKC